MPNRLKRYYGTDHLHFITFTCYHRQPWLASQRRRDLFLKVFEQVRQRYQFVVVGYVVMPEHVHLLLSEPEKSNPSGVIQAIKQGFARHVLRSRRSGRKKGQAELLAGETEHGWQKRFYDFNVCSKHKRIEKLRYMHRNPVSRGLVLEPEQWTWSSYRSYACGEAGAVKINQWGAVIMRVRGDAAKVHLTPPLHKSKGGPPARSKICQLCPRSKMSTMSPAGQHDAATRLRRDSLHRFGSRWSFVTGSNRETRGTRQA